MSIQLACSRRPRALEEAHHWNKQAKFYNVKFPLVYESDNSRDSLYEEHGATLKHKCGKGNSSIAPFFLDLLFFSLAFLFFWGQCSIEWWSSHFYLFTTQWLQLDTRTKYDSIWMPPAVYPDMQWIKSVKCERIMLAILWSCKAIWQWWSVS